MLCYCNAPLCPRVLKQKSLSFTASWTWVNLCGMVILNERFLTELYLFNFFFFFSCCLKKKRKTSVVNFLTNTSENIFFLWGDNNGFPTYETYYVLCTCWIAQEIVLLNNFSQKAWTAVCRSQQTNSLWLPTWTGQSAVLCAVHTARGGFCLWVKPCSSSSIFWVSL